MRSLAGKTALVTGAAAGIGRAIARRLAKQGVELTLVDRNPIGLASVAHELREAGATATSHHCDLADAEQVVGLARRQLERSAGVDLLVNNAGVAHYGPTHEMAWRDWERLMTINYASHVRLTHELLPSLLARPEAHVLNVCSILGLAGMPRVTAYCSTKFAMIGFSESLRREYGRAGLGVTALCPGFVRTGLLDDATADKRRLPPRWLCVSADKVARAAVRGVRRNRRRVVVDPVGRFIRGAIGVAPDLFDWMQSLGRSRRLHKKHSQLEALSQDRDEALRLVLDLEPPEAPAPPKRLAA